MLVRRNSRKKQSMLSTTDLWTNVRSPRAVGFQQASTRTTESGSAIEYPGLRVNTGGVSPNKNCNRHPHICSIPQFSAQRVTTTARVKGLIGTLHDRISWLSQKNKGEAQAGLRERGHVGVVQVRALREGEPDGATRHENPHPVLQSSCVRARAACRQVLTRALCCALRRAVLDVSE